MKVEWSRKAATVGGVLTIMMLVFVAFHANTFTGYVPYGNLMLVIAIVSALLMCPAIGVRWDTNKRIYGVLLLVFFLVVPLLMEIVIERCNGKFITEFYGAEDWLDNYNVILLLYLLLFAITGRYALRSWSSAPFCCFLVLPICMSRSLKADHCCHRILPVSKRRLTWQAPMFMKSGMRLYSEFP